MHQARPTPAAIPAPNPFSLPAPWEAVATGYELSTMNYLGGYARQAISHLSLQPNSRVIDVACGPGTVTRMISGKVASVAALDFSAPMIALLQQYLSRQGIKNVSAVIGDGQALPYDDGEFDAGISMFGLMFFPDRMQGFRELHRVVKPGGRVAVSAWAPVSESPAMTLMFGSLRAANPELPEPKANTMNLENPDLFKSEMAAAGFCDVEIVPSIEYIDASCVKDFWDFMTIGSAPLVMMRKSAGEQKWATMERDALAYLDKEMTSFPVSLGSKAWIGIASR